jgi:hypothetical protein
MPLSSNSTERPPRKQGHNAVVETEDTITGDIAKNKVEEKASELQKNFSPGRALRQVTEMKPSNGNWIALSQLLQQLIAGKVRRNTFTQWEMELLLDLQMMPLRKSTRADLLKRYSKQVQQQQQDNAPMPMRFSRFYEREMQQRKIAEVVVKTRSLPRAS